MRSKVIRVSKCASGIIKPTRLRYYRSLKLYAESNNNAQQNHWWQSTFHKDLWIIVEALISLRSQRDQMFIVICLSSYRPRRGRMFPQSFMNSPADSFLDK